MADRNDYLDRELFSGSSELYSFQNPTSVLIIPYLGKLIAAYENSREKVSKRCFCDVNTNQGFQSGREMPCLYISA